MKLAKSSSVAISILVLPLLLTGCGDAGAPPRSADGLRPAVTPTQSTASALRPTGTSARDVSYRCNSGREGTITVDVPDLGRLADRLNRMQPCDYDHGLSRATLTVMCRSSPLVVHLTGAGGHVAQPSKVALCLQ